MLIAGIYYQHKEKEDVSSVKLYRTIALIGFAVAVVSSVIRFAIL